MLDLMTAEFGMTRSAMGLATRFIIPVSVAGCVGGVGILTHGTLVGVTVGVGIGVILFLLLTLLKDDSDAFGSDSLRPRPRRPKPPNTHDKSPK